MRRGQGWTGTIAGLLILTAGVLGAALPAVAVSTGYVVLQNGATFAYGGLQFTVSGCVLTLDSTVQTSCTSYTDVTTNSATAGQVVFAGAEIGKVSAGAGGTNPIIGYQGLNAATGANGGNLFNSLKKNNKIYDLAFTLTATKDFTLPTTTITTVTETISASAGPAGQVLDTTFTNTSFSNGAANMSTNPGSPTATDTFTAVTTLTFNVDLKVSTTTGATYSLTHYCPVNS